MGQPTQILYRPFARAVVRAISPWFCSGVRLIAGATVAPSRRREDRCAKPARPPLAGHQHV